MFLSAAATEAGDDTLLQQSRGRGQDAAAGQLPRNAAAQPQGRLHLFHCRLDRQSAWEEQNSSNDTHSLMTDRWYTDANIIKGGRNSLNLNQKIYESEYLL